MELRLTCEHCDCALPNDSDRAMICTYDCTFCKTCVEEVLFNVCPNCGGGFEKRPTRPAGQLEKYPPRQEKVFKPIDPDTFAPLLKKYRDVDPRKRI